MKNLFLKGFTLFCSLTLTLACTFKLQAQTVTTYSYTGSFQTFVIPACVGQVTLETWGAEGGGSGISGNSYSGFGGKGGYAIGSLTVVPGNTLYVYVGGYGLSSSSGAAAGGFNGGGSGYASDITEPGNGGGGASDVRLNGQSLSNRVIVGGGGGGGGEDAGDLYGHGGGLTGVGYNTTYDASQTGPGSGGSLGLGGSTNLGDGGGGGGGYYGGGTLASGSIGADTQGGGGGSGYVGTLTATNLIAGNATMPDPAGGTMTGRAGHGIVRITYAMNGAGVTVGSSPAVLCASSQVTLTAASVSSYTWLPVGSFTGANTPTIVDSPVANTVYTVQGTNTQGCISSAVYTLEVDQAVPTLTVVNTASATSGICPTKSVVLTASGARSYTWAANSGSVTNGVAFYPTTSGIYTVTGSNACGTSTAAVSLSIHPLPTINTVVSSPSVCSTSTVMFTAVGNATSYVWSGGIPNGSPIYLSTNTTATVIGTSAEGCTAQAVAFVSVVTTPVSQPLSNPPLICVGSSATITAPGATSYTWTTPSGTLGTTQIVVSPVVTTSYTVSKSNANCVNTQTVQVIVNNLPSVQAFATPPVICSGKTSVLQGGGALTFTWTAPGFTTTGASPTVTPINSTTYVVTASDGTCINTASTQVLTNPNPVITIAPSATAICRGEAVNLSANGALSYTWTTSSGTLTAYPSGTAVASGFQDSPDQTTLYTIIGENTYTCFTTVSQVVVVNPTPTLNIQTTKPLVCTGAVSNLTVTGANTYLWDANAGNSTTSVTPVTPAVTTVYSVTGYYNGTQCNTTKTIQVAVFLPTFAVNTPTSSCLGGTIQLTASGAKSYTWATIPEQKFSQISVSPSTPTFYVVSATSNSNGVDCQSTRTVDVYIYANPTITAATSKTLVCKSEPAILTGGGGSTYTWTPSQSSLIGGTVSVSPVNNTTYNVVGTDQNGCKGTSSVVVKVSTCFGIEEMNGNAHVITIYPNPNNGQFTISADKNLSLDLINSLGQLVKTINVNAGENQKIDVGHLPAGVYFISGVAEGEKFSQKLILKD